MEVLNQIMPFAPVDFLNNNQNIGFKWINRQVGDRKLEVKRRRLGMGRVGRQPGGRPSRQEQ